MNRRFLFPLALALLASLCHAAEPPEPSGTLPLGKDGKPLNLDFEAGTLRDWTATGEAFQGQPYKGLISPQRPLGAGKVANFQGQYWIGGFELLMDAPTGSLTSAPFKVTHPFAAFRFNGGRHAGTRVELVRVETGEPFFRTSGHDSETMLPVVVDLQSLKNQEIFIRLVDEVSTGWGHINFDDFRFYDVKPQFAKVAPAGPGAANLPPHDTIKNSGLTPEEAVKAITLPPGFRAHLFAAEPDVKQPIAFALDDRGRLWVAEAYTYPRRAAEGEGQDRILVLEDKDGDGKFDRRTVFMEGLNLVSGIEVGFGGVWVGAAPYLMFIPVAEGDVPRPAGEPRILLDGWGWGDTHETLNTFTWGPDGWLYGCHGIFTHSAVGKPGTADEARTKINAGIWRYHPVKHRFELFAEGTSNPWGLDFNEHGHCIIEACVIPHLWHVVQGARYQRQAGQHFNPHIFDDIKTIADHVHWAGGGGPHAGNSRSDSAGGGHAHAGLMIYLGGSWPAQYRGAAFMNNIHGARINVDTLEPRGSGYVGKHGADFLLFNDVWSQIINLQSDQDGAVYLIDWYDKYQCHNNDPAVHDRSNGRIFKVEYGEPKRRPAEVDVERLSDTELALAQFDANDWWVRHTRRVLQERAAAGKLSDVAHAPLAVVLRIHNRAEEVPFPQTRIRTPQRLRALWALHAIGRLSEHHARVLLQDKDEHVRAWTIQLLCEDAQPSEAVRKEFARMAKDDASPVVRLYLASAAQRLAPEQRWDVVAGLHGRGEDAGDHNLPLMNWYALEPLAPLDFNRALAIALESKLPRALEFTARRMVAHASNLWVGAGETALPQADPMAALVAALQRLEDEPRKLAMLTGMSAALRGQRSAPEPQGWDALEEKLVASKQPELRALTESLSLTFGSRRALEAGRRVLADRDAAAGDRLRALDSLLNVKDAALPPLLFDLLREPPMRAAALRGLAAFADPKTPDAVLAIYASLAAPEKRDALLTLASRAPFARTLLAAIAEQRIPATDISADIARQIRGLNDPELTKQLEQNWGTARESSAERQKDFAKYRTIATAKNPPTDARRGRAIFTRTCAQCHVLFDAGGKIGPDITGANRNDIDYLLHNIVDPNAEIPNQYRTAMVELNDGRIIAGIANQQDPKVVAIAAGNETVTVPKNEIKKLTLSEFSMMPEGLLTPLSDQEVRDLLTYLRSPAQVSMPPEQAAK